MGLFARLRDRLSRTRSAISDGVSALFRGGRQIDRELLAELEELLYTADLGPLATELVEELARLHRRGELAGEEDVRSALRRMLLEHIDPQEAGSEPPPDDCGADSGTDSGEGDSGATFEVDLDAHHPTVILVVGVNGSGKTTTIAKLAHRFQARGKRVLLGAADTFRAAAADQLEIWAQRNGADIVRQQVDNADPAAVAFDAVSAAVARDVDVVLIDTAGRLHTQRNLMEELAKVRRVLGRCLEGAPHHTWLVLDGTNGQNAVQQAKHFTAAVEVSGLIVAKLDGTARGGAVFAIRRELGLPVRYVGTGEQLELLEVFDPRAFVDAIVSRTATAATE